MSTMPKNAPPKQIPPLVSAPELLEQVEASLRSEINLAQQIIQSAEERLRKIAELRGGIPSQERPTTGLFRYLNMTFIQAICLYLERTQRPWTREHLIEEVIDGGVYTGKGERAKGDAVVQANKSLNYFLMSREQKQETYGKRGHIKAVDPKLRQVRELIGLAQWPDEKFQVE